MNKSDIVGQSSLIDGFKSILNSGRIVHSYIFTGPKGVGKKTMSNYFAKMLLCSEEQRPCNQCKSCTQFDSQNHPDVIRIKTEEKTIKVDVIREIRRNINIKPSQGPWKVYIIEKGDTMNQHAQNAFLKTLEEPPKYVIIMILVENVGNLYPTIVSRCQQLRVSPLPMKQLVQVVQNKMKLPSKEAEVFAKLSEGLPGRAIELASSMDYRKMRDDTLEMVERISRGTLVEAMKYIDYFQKNKDNTIAILDMMEIWFRDIMVLKQGRVSDIIINLDKLTRLESLANIFTIPNIQCNIESIEGSKRKLEYHANYQLTIENLLMNIQGSGKNA